MSALLSPSKEQNEKQFLDELSVQEEGQASPRPKSPVLSTLESLQLNLVLSQDDEIIRASPLLDGAGQSQQEQQTIHHPQEEFRTPSPFASPDHQSTSPMHLRFSSSPEDVTPLSRKSTEKRWLFDPYTGKPRRGESC